MLITSIRQSSPGRLILSFEDGSELRSSLGVVTDMRLCSGRELDAEELEELRLCSAQALAREKALEYLSRRPMSAKELKTKLILKGQDEAIADHCVRWLSDRQLIDDESYAASLTRHYAARGYGPGRIRAELSRRGIDRELWDGALEQLPENNDKMDRFIAARLKDPEDREQLRKISAALYRRGYSWEDIRAGLERFRACCPDEY